MQRRLLMAIVNAFKWLAQSFTNLYYSLIPTTISGKSVKNKAKISKIYGNSVVENQLIDNLASTQTILGITFVNNNDNTWTVKSGTATGNSGKTPFSNANKPNWVNGHKYLFVLNGFSNNGVKLIKNPNGFTIYQTTIITQDSSEIADNYPRIYVQNGVTISNDTTVSVEIIDLTLMFGTGNEPTTLTDVRVQALLNRGYIQYNTGEIKSVDISEFSSEPYNLLSLDRPKGTLSGFSNATPRNFEEGKYYLGLADNNYYSAAAVDSFSKTDSSITIQVNNGGYGVAFPFKIIPNKSYTLETDETYPKAISWYDENGKYISENYTSNQKTISGQAPNNAYWGVIVLIPAINTSYTYSNICFHRTSTRTGYAPYTQPQTLPFIYQGNGAGTSHDTFEITSSEYVFTKKVGIADLGTLSWFKYGSNQGVFRTSADALPLMLQTGVSSVNSFYLICNYLEDTNNNAFLGTQNCIAKELNRLIISIPNATDITSLIQTISGKLVYYPFETPQVIRIPKKHLGIVNLGNLNWYYDNETGHETMFSEVLNNIAKPSSSDVIANIYTNKYLSATWSNLYSHNGKNIIAIQENGRIRVYAENMGTNPTDFKNAMNGIYLFYETESEVADIETKVGIEAGGTLTSDSDVLPNVDVLVKCK